VTDVSFYHLLRRPLEAVLPKLLEKTLKAEKRAVVLASSKERLEMLNGVLWTYDQDSWLPHGSAEDGEAQDQPVWLSLSDENPNQAQFLFLTDGAASGSIENYERCFELFDGNDPEAVSAARTRWKDYQKKGFDLAYWRETDEGGWEKEAEA
jgi:DNA polymerase III subunit chi